MIVRVVTILWCLSVSTGFIWLGGHAARPGLSGAPTPQWPTSSRLRLATDRPTLLMFLDPLCPCSRASLSELELSLARCRSPIAAYVVLGRRGRSAVAISGVNVLNDDRAEEQRRFGVATSGHMLVFDPSGRVVFSGGITTARGHEGESIGGEAVVELARGSTPSATSAPVFGCPLPDGTEVSLTEPAR